MKRRSRIVLVAVTALCVLALAVVCMVAWFRPALPPLPNPNAYDDFAQAGKVLVSAEALEDYPAADENELRLAISTNTETFRLLRLGLTREYGFPMDRFQHDVGAVLEMLSSYKRLAQLLAADGRLAELEGRTNDAVASYVDAIKFGNEISRGGPLINCLVGIACEGIGCSSLAKLVPQLTPEQSRRVIAACQEIDAQQVSWDEVWRNERAFMWRQSRNPLLLIATAAPMRPAKVRAEERIRRIKATVRLLAAELSIRCYQQEKGHPPARLDELVPKFLKAVPQDPFTGKPLIYRPQETDWLLYSVGPDRVDNGGLHRVGKGTSPPGTDLFYDQP